MNPEFSSRIALLAGDDMMRRLADTRVLLVGIGGVGSWCAEALVRSGIGHLTIVDRDRVAPSNINRQLPATSSSIGRPKVNVLAERLLDINPELQLDKIFDFYSPENADSYNLDDFDYVLDAIDSRDCKAELILRATASRATFFSSMGAARKIDPAKVAVADFWKVQGCPLARSLRQLFKRTGHFPRHKFKCVYSPETLPHRAEPVPNPVTGEIERANGTFAHITAIFGFTLASLVIRDLYSKSDSD